MQSIINLKQPNPWSCRDKAPYIFSSLVEGKTFCFFASDNLTTMSDKVKVQSQNETIEEIIPSKLIFYLIALFWLTNTNLKNNPLTPTEIHCLYN